MSAVTGKTWQERLALVVEMMREVSRQTDPQAMVRAFGDRIRKLRPVDGIISLSRRDLEWPRYRITRSSAWKDDINPWKERDRLPLFEGGLLAELIYSDQPRIIDDLQIAPNEPAAEYLTGFRSLAAIPHYDGGVALNMVLIVNRQPHFFHPEEFPDMVLQSNLFGRATHNLVLSGEVKTAYDEVDRELKTIADIQRSLLPAKLPTIPTLELAAHYQTSRRAGGDYYDFFPLPDDRWGILIADVSGHGTPAAVLMAVTHAIAHSYPGPPAPADEMLRYVNHHLSTRYTSPQGTFVTAFYGIYDPATRTLRYACAGHNPPRLKRCASGAVLSLDGPPNLPLGVAEGEPYEERTFELRSGDLVIFYTDGITEAINPGGEFFGSERLDTVLARCRDSADDIVRGVLSALEQFTAGQAAIDDRTLVVAKVH